MKRLVKLLLGAIVLVLMMISSFKITTSADTGPKESVKISIEGNTSGMYLTLLSSKEGSGPWYVSEEDIEGADSIDTKFSDYAATDSFYYLYNYSSIEDGSYHWGYYPPETFKIVIYDSVNDKIITDGIEYTREYFNTIYTLTLTDSSYNVDVTSYDTFTVDDESGDTKNLVLGFLLRLVICLAIEVVIAFLFKIKRWQYLVVVCVNVTTQLILNLILLLIIKNNGFNEAMLYTTYTFVEIAIIGIEWLAYILFINRANKENEISKLKLLIYSLSANAASFVLGFIILQLLEY